MTTATATDPAKLAELCRIKARLTEARNALNDWPEYPDDPDAGALLAEASNNAGDATDAISRLIDHLAG